MSDAKKLQGKRILVTGVAGTVGKALVKQLSTMGVGSLVGMDNSEVGLFSATQDTNVEFMPILGDIRDKDTLLRIFKGIDLVFHLAALKHVPLCERDPLEAIKTNIYGVNNVIDAALNNEVEHVINTSTDKAVNPFNVMGTSKLMGEQLVRAANLTSKSTKFSSIRFGNVLGSSGSVIPIFIKQITKELPITLTSRDMTRFVMTLSEAVSLIIESSLLANGGETYVTKMNTIRVETLAEVMIEELGNDTLGGKDGHKIVEVGPRPGEKLYEELMNAEEARRSRELDNHYVILPALTDIYTANNGLKKIEKSVGIPYNSSTQEPMHKEELRLYLQQHEIV